MTGCNLLDFGTPARKNGKRLPCEVLQAENAKLRELINILAFCTNDEAHDCDKCVMNGAEMHVTVPEWLFCDSLIERLRTLGFEVTE